MKIDLAKAVLPSSRVHSFHADSLINGRITYKHAPMHVLEKFCFKYLKADHKAFLDAGFTECVLLQTCNRVEVYACAAESDAQLLLETWARHVDLSAKDFADVKVTKGMDAVNHLIRLSSGLDSLVVGEDQILGQVRRAFEFARSNLFVGKTLSSVFDRALKAGGRIRAATGINKGNVSVASVALNIAEEYFDNLRERKILLIGTGEAATLIAKLLKNQGVDFVITSRTYERAKWFAGAIAGKPMQFDDALEILNDIDIVFVATTAPYLLVTHDRIDIAMRKRFGRGLMVFDLSNPRTVDERVQSILGVKLVTMDQISELAGKNLQSRLSEFDNAEQLVKRELESADSTFRKMKAEPSIVSIFKSVDAIRQRELKKTFAMLEKDRPLTDKETRILEQLSYAIVEGILSVPMNNLRKQIAQGDLDNDALIGVAAKLFSYEDEQKKLQ